jgi:hypothetical protein
VKYVLQAIRVALLVAMVGVAFVPVLALGDLTEGGTGLGLCAAGLSWCDNSYFIGPEILAALTLVIAFLLGLFHYSGKAIWLIERKRQDDLRRQSVQK